MLFTIKKDATLPLLMMRPIENSGVDYQKFMTMLENSAITFSMREINTGIYRIANKKGGIVLRTKRVNNNQLDEYYIYYKFTKSDTSKPGIYEASFHIDFFGSETGNLIVPIKESLIINVLDSFTRTTVTSV